LLDGNVQFQDGATPGAASVHLSPHGTRETSAQHQLQRGLTSYRSQSVLTGAPSVVETAQESQEMIDTLENKVKIMGNAKESLHKKHAYNQTKLQKRIETLKKENERKEKIILEKDKEIKLQ
jgi:hypothetical protein